MKKIVSICLTMLLILSCMATVVFATEETTNLLVNGTFDTDLSGWNGKDSTWNEGGYVTLPAIDKYALTQSMSVTPNERYVLSFDAKNEEGGTGILVYVYFFDADGVNLHATGIQEDTVVSNWKFFAKQYTAPDTAVSASIHLRNNNGARVASYDNVSFVNVEDADATGNMGMEILNENNTFPKDYEVEGTAALETTEVFEGKNAIKLSNADNASVTKVSTSFVTCGLKKGEHFELLLRFKLADVDAEAKGAKLSIMSGKGDGLSAVPSYPGHNEATTASKTGYFKDDTYTGWRQMMVYFNGATVYTATVELEGKATLYIDDFVLRKASYYVNGDFQGLDSDKTPAGWLSFKGGSTSAQPVWAESEEAPDTKPFLKEVLSADGKTYENYAIVHSSMTNGKGAILRQNFTPAANDFVVGKTYRISADYCDPSKVKGLGVSMADSFTTIASYTTKSSGSWENKEVYALYSGTSTAASVNLHWRGAGDTKIYFDNAVMSPVEENITFTETENEGGEVLVSYRKPGTTFDDAEKKATLVVAVYRHDNNGKTLDSIKILEDTAKLVASSAPAYAGTEPAVGYRPVMIDCPISLPTPTGTESYTIKAFAWDGVNTLIPNLNAAEFSPVAQ